MIKNLKIEPTAILEKIPISVSTLCYRSIENTMHIHSYTHISFVLAGEANGVIGETKHTFSAGCCSVAAPYLPHSFDTRASEDTPIVVHIRFNNSFLTERGYRFFHYNRVLRFEERTIPTFISFEEDKLQEVVGIIRNITLEFEKGKNMSYDCIAEHIAKFFRIIADKTPQEPISPLTQETIDRIAKAIKYISQHYMEKITINDVLPVTAMSRSLFTKQFRAITGMTFVNYLNTFRLGRATQLILTKEMSLNEVAKKTGLYNKTNLVRVFGNHFGMPPMKFRDYYNESSPGVMERDRMYQKRWKWLNEENNENKNPGDA